MNQKLIVIRSLKRILHLKLSMTEDADNKLDREGDNRIGVGTCQAN